MADFKFPESGSTKWHVESEMTWGISPFVVMEIDWKNGSGTCRWGKLCMGKISNVKVNSARDEFSAAFMIVHTHRGKPGAMLAGTMKVTVNDDNGEVAMKIAGMADWKDNTTFLAARVEDTTPVTHFGGRAALLLGGKHFDVTLKTSVAAKLMASVVFGNLNVRDRDRQLELTYPLMAVGAGLAVGVTVLSRTTFNDVKLKIPRREWAGATIEIFSQGTNVIVGSNFVKLTFTLPDRQTFSMETKGTEHLGVNADVSMNWGSGQIGVLGPKTGEVPY